MADPYIGFEKKFSLLQEESLRIYKFLNDRVYFPLKENLIVIQDKSDKYISFLIKVMKEHQDTISHYVHSHYQNVCVTLSEQWMRLDFNNDGQVDAEDLKEGMIQLYEFMANYEYF